MPAARAAAARGGGKGGGGKGRRQGRRRGRRQGQRRRVGEYGPGGAGRCCSGCPHLDLTQDVDLHHTFKNCVRRDLRWPKCLHSHAHATQGCLVHLHGHNRGVIMTVNVKSHAGLGETCFGCTSPVVQALCCGWVPWRTSQSRSVSVYMRRADGGEQIHATGPVKKPNGSR